MSNSTERWNNVDHIDRMTPASKRAELGTTMQEVIDQVNALGAAVSGLATKLMATLTHLDADTKTAQTYSSTVGTLSTATIAGYDVTITGLNDRTG